MTSSAAADTRRPDFTTEGLHYPPELPVTVERPQILHCLQQHQVVVVAGETGSGKTTQLPKMLLELGAHQRGMIGHTQPRRIAARSVAERLAEELGSSIGDTVGYQVRFTSEVSADTDVKLMTDGILLAEIQHDPQLRKYSALIIDEAHERSLNIDVILGYLKQLLPQRPDLQVIITSATIDVERLADHFANDDGPAPVLEVSGRTYPVEIRYRPPLDPADPIAENDDASTAQDPGPARNSPSPDSPAQGSLSAAVVELSREPEGDILAFFPGEREIREAADELGQLIQATPRLRGTELLPLYGRLSMPEQRRVFQPGKHRRIVLATNVAETSLTVPGIRYVIDTGTARISRYSTRSKVQRLPIEPISQASANQRAGRSGRTSPGVCIRLYSQEDFAARPEFTDPEILRTSLASTLLQLSSMGITKNPQQLLDFPFVQPPESRAVNDAVRVLQELGALSGSGAITGTGRTLTRLPVDPRLGRMLLEAKTQKCLHEVIVLVAALSLQDIRERPTENRDAADQYHRRFQDDVSDFSALLNLFNYITEQQAELSSSQFRKLCRREYLNWLRIREWQDLITQLADIAQQASLGTVRKASRSTVDPVSRHEQIHLSLLSGLLGQIGLFQPRSREYQGPRGTRFAIFPGSGVQKKNHDLVMAAELVETSRLWARMVAKITPEWVERMAGELLKRRYAEPVWSASRGAVIATERATLFGVPIIADRRVLYGRINPVYAREEFIRQALINGDWNTRHHFDRRNRERFAELDELEERTRRRHLRATDDQLIEFFAARLPPDITSQRAFDAWWKTTRHTEPQLLDIPDEVLRTPEAEQVDPDDFPESFDHDGLPLELTYAYEAGVTVRIPVVFLNTLDPARFDWFIPGRRLQMITALIRALPKTVRKQCVPAPDVAAAALKLLNQQATPWQDPFRPALVAALRELRGVQIQPEDLDIHGLEDNLRFTFAVISERGRVLETSADLAQLQRQLSQQNRQAISAAASPNVQNSAAASPGGAKASPGGARKTPNGAATERHSAGTSKNRAAASTGAAPAISSGPARLSLSASTPHSAWDFGDIPKQVITEQLGQRVTGYPALEPAESGVTLYIASSPAEQAWMHRRGVVELLRCVLPSPARYVVDHLSGPERIAFGQFSSPDVVIKEATATTLDHLLPEQLPFTEAEFTAISRQARAELIEAVLHLASVISSILSTSAELSLALKQTRSAALAGVVADIRAQREHLVYPGFIAATSYRRLEAIPRYLQAALWRLQRLQEGQSLPADATAMQQIQEIEDSYDAAVEAASAHPPIPQALTQVGWLIEELRVGLFAQHLGTTETVSVKRVKRALQQAKNV